MTPASGRIGRLLRLGLFTLAILAGSLLFNTDRTVSAVWYGPYLSAACNSHWGKDFLVNVDEVKSFADLPPSAQRQYRFTRTDNLVRYEANPIGFVYVVRAAKTLFPWLSDVSAVKALQIAVHTIMCIALIALLQPGMQRVAFLALYAVNPLVIYFVTNPIYFFWQALPSFGLAVLLILRQRNAADVLTSPLGRLGLLAIFASLALALLIRPTTLGAVGVFFLLAIASLRKRGVLLAGAAVFAAVLVTGYTPNQKNFWHTPYVGIGAYANQHMQGLSDDNGYAMFERKTGHRFNASLGGPYYDAETMSRYSEATRDEYLRIARAEWPMLARNAAVNMLQGFSIGYLVGRPAWVQYAIAVAGLLALTLLLYSRQYWLVLAIAGTNATFALYFPPIQAYMFGSYMLLALGAVYILTQLRQSQHPR